MNDDPTLLPETLATLSAAFAPGAELVPVEHPTLDDVRAFLTEKIAVLLDRNPGMLMSILYRIDVAERKVTAVLTTYSPEAIPPALADLVIERQLQKLRIRRHYREKAAREREEDDADLRSGF
ncbi:hypothetical protein [Rhodocaloribacter sp.]